MKKLFIILALFTCFKAFGQTPTNPTPVNQMTWYKDLAGHMWAYRGATLGWIQMVDFSQLNNGGFLPKGGDGITIGSDSTINLGGNILNDVFLNSPDNYFFVNGNHIFGSPQFGYINDQTTSLYYNPITGLQLSVATQSTTATNNNTIFLVDNQKIEQSVLVNGAGQQKLTMSMGSNGTYFNPILLSDPLRKGFLYNWDDDSNLSDSSLVPKRYVDAHSVDSASIANRLAAKVDTATYDVFLLAIQQSNGQGHGDSTSSTKIVPGSALMYYNGIISALKDPVGNAIYGSAWPAFALRYYKLTGHKLLFVPRAKGGSAMCAQSDGGNGRWSPSGLLRYQARDTMYAALAKMALQGLKIGKISGIMVHGEQDGVAINGGTETIAQYRDTTANTIAFFRNYWPKMQWGIIRTGKSIGFDFYSGPRTGQEQVAAADSLTQIISRDTYDFYENGMLLPDNLHYNQKGLNFLGDVAAQQFVSGFKHSNVYTIFSKTGVGVNTPLALLDVAASTDTIPGLVLRKGIISSTIVKGALMATGLHLTYTDSTSTNRMLTQYATASGITANNIPYATTNSNLTQDTSLNYYPTTKTFNVGIGPNSYSTNSKVNIKGDASSINILNLTSSADISRFRVQPGGLVIVPATGAMSVGTATGGVATLFVKGATSANTNASFQIQNSSSVSLFNVRDDGLVSLDGAQMLRIPTLAGDPGFLSDRGIWYNSSISQFSGRRNGVTIRFAAQTDTTILRSVANSYSLSGMQTKLNNYALLASPTFTGTPTLPTGTIGVTQSAGNSTTALATTAFVTTADNLKANIASPTFTGVPAAPTPASNVNTTQIPTTAWTNTYFGALAAANVWTVANQFNLEATFSSGIITRSNNPIQMYGTGNTNFGNLFPTTLTSDRNWNLPDKDGILATVSDIGVSNSTTTALSAATLNSTYPSATVGFKVVCDLITGAPAIYVKASGTTWLTVASTITP